MKRIKLLFFSAFLIAGSSIQAQEVELKAFPTAEGFGKYATGGRGGRVVTVTNLEDDADGTIEGSFRWATKQYDSDFTIVFAVSGEIRLVSDLRASKKKNLTVAGQTAPGDGIYFSGGALNFGGGENIIIRHIRSRVGHLNAGGDLIEDNAFLANNINNVIIDHCSFGWSAEEVMNVYDAKFLTVQWCLIHEGLYDAGHKKGARSYATQWGGCHSTYHHNLLAHNNSRSPRFNGAVSNDSQVFIEFTNNVNYNWGNSGACYGGENTGGGRSIHEINMLNNYYKPGPATSTPLYFVRPSYARKSDTSNGPSQWHLSGNIMEGSEEVTADNWLGVRMDDAGNYYSQEEMRVDTIIIPDNEERTVRNKFDYYDYSFEQYTYADYQDAKDAFESVIAINSGAGAWPHDEIDIRVLEDVKEGRGEFGNKGIINFPDDAEGYISYSVDYDVPVDTDGDGIPDEWELAHGLNPNDPEDGNYINSIGYTALEAYLNDLVGESVGDMTFTVNSINVNEIAGASLALVSNVIDEELLLQDNEGLSIGSIYNMNGVRMMNINLASSSAIQVGHLSEGHYVLVATTDDGQVKTARFVKKK